MKLNTNNKIPSFNLRNIINSDKSYNSNSSNIVNKLNLVILTLVCVFLFDTISVYSNWVEKTTGTTKNLTSLHFRKTSQVAYAVGESGVVIRTANEGETWAAVSGVPTNNKLNSVFFTSDNTGFVAGDGGVISRTINSGTNWTTQTSRTTNNINGIYFKDDNNGFYVANGGELRSTTNAGTTWSSTNLSPTSNNLTSITFPSSSIGYAGGSNGTILKTINGGSTWSLISNSFTYDISSIAFFDDTTGVMCTFDSRVLRTINGGTSWINDQRFTSDSLFSVTYSTDRNRIYLAGNSGSLYVSTNAGVNWSYQPSIITNYRAVAFTKLNTGFLVGGNGKSLKTTNGGQNFPKTLELLTPNVNLNLTVGQDYEIKWNSSNIENMVVQYSTNNGTNWTTIGVVVAVNQKVNWVVPNVFTTLGKVRIYDAANQTIADTSSGLLTIDNKTLTLTSPNGGESFNTNSSQSINWTSQNIENIKIEYSLNNGNSWTNIINSTPAASGSYAWTVPNISNTVNTARVRILDVESNTKADTSNNVFTIQAPTLTLNLPRNFDTIQASTNYNISWSANNSPNVHILLSLNNGMTYDTLAKNLTSNSNNFIYSFVNQNVDKAKIRIVNANNNSIFAETLDFFVIRAIPILLTYPRGGEEFVVGLPQRITWDRVGVNFVTVDFSINNGTSWTNIIKDFPANNNSYDWVVTDNPSQNAIIRIYNADGDRIYYDTVNAPFKIVKLKLLSPNANADVYANSNFNIAFDAKFTGSLKLEFSANNGVNWTNIANNISPETNQFTWNVGSEPVQNAKIRIINNSNLAVRDSVNFNIVVPSLAITKPNGGEFYQVGRRRMIEWNSSFVNKVNIQFSTNSGLSWQNIVSGFDASSGKFSWMVPHLPNNNSLIRIIDADRANVNDVSNGFFTITTERVDLLTPNGTEVIYTNQIRQIKWSAPSASKVDLLISRDNGINWSVIASNLNVSPNTYNWTVPNIPSAQALLKVRDAQKPDIEDETDKTFEIVGLALTTPKNTNEKWIVNNNYQIKWASHRVGAVNLQYSINNGTFWTDIVKNYPAGAGFYTWNIPNQPTLTAKIRIFDPQNTSFADTTTTPFTITGLVITSPAGGEDVLIGDDISVTWNSNNIDNLKIELTTDNGLTWNTLEAFYQAVSGSYTFRVPESPSNRCRIKISSVEDTTFSDISNLFTIKGNGVVVKSPNGGEVYQIGSTQIIRWSSANVASVNLYYSPTGGANVGWVGIANNLNPNLKQFSWTVPDNPSTEYRIKITDAQNEEISDLSDANFTAKGVGFKPPTSWNVVTYTGANSTIIIPSSARVTLGSRNIDTNDAIGIFYKRGNIEYCAGSIIWKSLTGNKAITVWGDNTLTPIKDGMETGDSYIFKFWDGKEGKEYYAAATYSTGTNFYSVDGISQVSSLSSSKSLNINLGANQWTLMSSNLIPANSDWKVITAAIQDTSFRIKDDSGKLYYPGQGIADLVSLEMKSAYLMYVNNPTTLSISGSDAQLNFYDFVLNTGRWYFMSYLPQISQPIATVYNAINTRIILVKNPAGQVYYPTLGINEIVTMKPGEGYRIAVNQNLTFRYPTPTSSIFVNTPNSGFANNNNDNNGKSIENKILSSDGKTKFYKNNFRTTGNSAVWIISAKEFENSDEIGVYTDKGLLIGSGLVKDGKAFVTVWGASGEVGIEIDGAKEGQNLKLVLWKSDKKIEYDMEVVAKANIITGGLAEKFLFYEQDAVWHIEAKRGEIYSSTEEEINYTNDNTINIYPNPTKDEIQLNRVLSQINLDKDVTKVMSLEVISSTGNVVLEMKNQENFDNQIVNYLDISNLSNGVYVLKVNIGTESYYGKFLKVE